jgi:hypothetical protein
VKEFSMRRWFLTLLLVAFLLLVGASAAAAAPLLPPWDGNPITHGLGPSYGETWPVPVPTGEAVYNLQGAPHDTSTLALMPYADVGPLLAQFQTEATAAGLPQRMTYRVSGQSAGGRDLYVAVVNDLETANQRRDYARWQHIREIELTNPAAAQVLLDSYGSDVKMPIYIEADINGNEYEGTDAMMQVLRDVTTTPLGQNSVVDNILNHSILVVVPTSNPDGRVMGIRGNAAVADTNRDYFVQSQPEEQIDAAIQQQWLATGALHLHGYVTPTLVDGDTMPLNPGTDAIAYYTWNSMRYAASKAAFTAAGLGIQSPVLDWNASGNIPTTYTVTPTGATQVGTTVTITTTASNSSQISVGYTVIIAGVTEAGYNGTYVVTGKPSNTTFTYTAATSGLSASGGGTAVSPAGPSYAQTWDGWGPFYGQTYMSFLGVDSSTVEMDSSAGNGGRMNAKKAQYLNFYSTANFWLDNRQAMMGDQLKMFLAGVDNAPTDPNAFAASSYLTSLGFTDYSNNWMVQFPKAYVVPWGNGQRSDAEANRIAQWCLNNGIQVQRMASDFTWNGRTFQAGSYVVSMSQALRGLAWNAFAAGTDIESKISILYASPAAWSHGLLWGADTFEIPRDDVSFSPSAMLIQATNSLAGGVRGGIDAPSDFYSVTLRGVPEDKTVLGLLADGINGYIAEAPFTSTTGGPTPAGTLIFPADSTTAAALDAAGQQDGVWFERNVGVTMPTATVVADAPRIAILVNSLPTSGADTDGCLSRIFGPANVKYVATTGAASSLQGSSTNPLNGFNVIYNAGGAWPSNSANVAPNLPSTISGTGATEAGTTVTITTSGSLPGTVKAGSSVTVAGVAVAGYNGTWTVTGTPATNKFTFTNSTSGLPNSGSGTVTGTDVVAGATESADTVTITMTNAYFGSLTTGSSVTIAGVGVAGYNGTFTVTGTPSATQFTYTNPTTGLAASGGGTVTSTDVNALAKSRLNSFFAHGGGYIATSTSSTGFSFLSSASPALVEGSLTQGSQSAYGGIAQWVNVAGANSPISGPYPSTDTMFLPSNVTYFSAVPTSNVAVDAQYPHTISTLGPANGFLSGMWLNRNAAANDAPVLVHGTTTASSRYVGYATNPFSRYDGEREWPLIVQAALWSDLIDQGQIAATITATAGENGAISPSGATLVAIGVDETYAITPDTGYHIADVLVDGVSVGAVDSYTFKNIAADHTIAASFAIDKFDITASAGANGSITPSGTISVDYGQDPVFTITPDPGYSVLDVLVDGVSVGAVTTYTFNDVAAAHTISATFAFNPVSWKVTFSLSKSSMQVNNTVKFSGAVSSSGVPASGSVKIQRTKSGGSWSNWKTASLNGAGKYSLNVKMTSKGTWYFRTVKASDPTHRTSYSRVLKLTVH